MYHLIFSGSTDNFRSSSSEVTRPPASALGFLWPPLSKLMRKTLPSPLRLFLLLLAHSPPPPSGFHSYSVPGTCFSHWFPRNLMTLGPRDRVRDTSLDPGRWTPLSKSLVCYKSSSGFFSMALALRNCIYLPVRET